MKEGMKTPAAELADIVLPAATWLEVDQVVTVPFVANNVALAQQKVAHVGESRPDEDVFVDLARRLGIREGDWVWIESPRGRIRQRARLTQIHPRVVNVQYGWWFPEEQGPEYGVWKSNANVLTSMDPPYDPALGTYQLRALLCKVYKDDADSVS